MFQLYDLCQSDFVDKRKEKNFPTWPLEDLKVYKSQRDHKIFFVIYCIDFDLNGFVSNLFDLALT